MDGRRGFGGAFVVLMMSVAVGGGAAAVQTSDPGLRVAELGACTLEGGATLRPCRVAYRTFGPLAEARDNVVLVPSWFGGTSRDLAPFMRPGALVDTTRYHVVVVDALGNGVSSSPSLTDDPEAFPEVSIRDMVRAQRRLLGEHLGIDELVAVVGISMGGMQALEWGATYPDVTGSVVAIAAAAWAGPWDRVAWDAYLRLARLGHSGVDEAYTVFEELEYLRGTSPGFVARTVADDSVPRLIDGFAEARMTDGQVLDRMVQARAVATHDVRVPYGGSLEAAAAAFRPRLLVIATTTDLQVTPGSAVAFAQAVGGELLLLDNDCGHAGANCEAGRSLSAVARHLEAASGGVR